MDRQKLNTHKCETFKRSGNSCRSVGKRHIDVGLQTDRCGGSWKAPRETGNASLIGFEWFLMLSAAAETDFSPFQTHLFDQTLPLPWL